MKKVFYLFCGLLSFMSFQSCEKNIESVSLESENIGEVTSTLEVSNEAESNIPAFTEALESEISLLMPSTKGYSMESFTKDYDFSVQQKITSSEKGGAVYLVQSKTDKDCFLALCENPDGLILNVKKIYITADENNATVAVFKVDNTDYITLSGNKEDKLVNVVSYNGKFLSITPTRNGCSAAIGGAGLIWGTAFGVLSMGAGFAAGLVFLVMSEIMC